MAPSLRWDIFCRIVDNFGDAGVCWRLARQLAREHGLAVTLWIDDVASLARFVAAARRPTGADQAARRHSRAPAGLPLPADAHLPDVVIEGFGCGLPDAYLAAMADAARAAGVDRARIPVRRAVDRRVARAAVAASAASAHALVLVPGLHAEDRRRAARSRPPRRTRRVSQRAARARRGVARARAISPPSRGADGLALLLREPGAAGAARRVGGRRRAGRVHRARRRRALRARPAGPAARCRIPARRSRAAASRSPSRPSSTRMRSTAACGLATSTSCAARIRSCARSGRASPTSGTSIRRTTTRT